MTNAVGITNSAPEAGSYVRAPLATTLSLGTDPQVPEVWVILTFYKLDVQQSLSVLKSSV